MTSVSQPDYLKIDHRRPVPKRAIRAIAKIIVERFDPEKIILFGSHAYGRPRPSSDVDLLVVMETQLTPREQRLKISREFYERPIGLDIIVRTPADLERRIALGDFFLREVVSKGKLIYERPHRRVDQKSRK